MNLIIILIPLSVLSFILAYFFVIPFFFGAPYEPSRGKALKSIIKFANPKSRDKIAELGSGDGMICIALAKKLSKNSKIKIYWKNFFKEDLSKYNKVVMFQFNTITNRLSKKFKRELKPSSIIVSHWWKLPNWKIKKQEGRVYLYKKD